MSEYIKIEKVNNGYLVEARDDDVIDETDPERHVFVDFDAMVEWLKETLEH